MSSIRINHLIAAIAQSSIEVGATYRVARPFCCATWHIIVRYGSESHHIAILAHSIEACIRHIVPIDASFSFYLH